MKKTSNKTLKIKRASKTTTSKKTKKQVKIHSYFTPSGKKITDQKIIDRINKLRIPPNYERVLISTKTTSKLHFSMKIICKWCMDDVSYNSN